MRCENHETATSLHFDFAHHHSAPRTPGKTTAVVCDARGSVALPHGKTRKTHYWHKKSQFGKRRKISATVKTVKNQYPERFTRFTDSVFSSRHRLCVLQRGPAQQRKLTQNHTTPGPNGPG